MIFDHGEGVWLTDVRGRSYIDGLASLWNVAIGHGRAELADVAAEQMRKAAFTNNYTGYSNVPAIELAEKLTSGLAYDNLQGVFFTNSVPRRTRAAKTRALLEPARSPDKVKIIVPAFALTRRHAADDGDEGACHRFWKYRPCRRVVHTTETEGRGACRTPMASAPAGSMR